MGLDFSHGNVYWSYSGFSNFRKKLANEIDMVLDEMEGYGGEKLFSYYNDGIIPLLDHSDCDGELTVDECEVVAPRLKELVEKWNDNDVDKRKALELVRAMEECIRLNESLEFC